MLRVPAGRDLFADFKYGLNSSGLTTFFENPLALYIVAQMTDNDPQSFLSFPPIIHQSSRSVNGSGSTPRTPAIS